MKKLMAIVLSLALALVSVLGSTGDALVYAQNTVTYQKETIFYGENFTVKYVIESQWNDEYIANVTITNTGETTIENWELSYESADEYSNMWNAVVSYHSAKNYNVKNAEHNQNIKPGESVSFGFQASFTNGKIDIPTSYKILGDKLILSNEECQVNFEVQSAWNNGCIMHVTIYNNSDENIEDWAMDWTFASGHKIDNIWRAKVVSQEGTTQHLKNCEYNSIIKPKQKETFGMQISFPDGEIPQYPTNVVVSQFKKDKWYLDFDKEWNRKMIHADAESVVAASKVNKGSIKVGLIDSGVDYSGNINVVEEENFVTEYDDVSILFSDLSGHGTAVAGLLGSSAEADTEIFDFSNEYMNQVMNEKIDGVNPYVDLYSARVLDENNETTIDRLVQGIEWAIEKDVKILNISCGVSSNSQKLYNVIRKAYDKGILIIAAAGDGASVQYPAKYSEVMAVGSIKCNGKLSENSPTGSEIEVVAPGEDVTTYGPLGMITSYSGTSMATPQVTALASILWQQDPSKSNEFIRGLIDSTARGLGDANKYGYGLIDCEYAINQYETYANSYATNLSLDSNLDNIEEQDAINNVANVLKTDEAVVKGYWGGELHRSVEDVLEIVRDGAVWPDNVQSKLSGMKDHPTFHGYYTKDYIKAYLKTTWVASKIKKSKKGKFPKEKGKSKFTKKIIKDLKKATEQSGFKKFGCTTKEQKAGFVYGIALHNVGDIFAHSTAAVRWKTVSGSVKKKKKDLSVKKLKRNWKKLTHGKRLKNNTFDPNKNFADNEDYIAKRAKSADDVCNAIAASCINGYKKGNISVFKEVKYYKPKKKPAEIQKKKQKKIYLKESYGIFNLTKYLKPKESQKKLNTIVNSVSNKKIKEVFANW